jgi:hypothetical protein
MPKSFIKHVARVIELAPQGFMVSLPDGMEEGAHANV